MADELSTLRADLVLANRALAREGVVDAFGEGVQDPKMAALSAAVASPRERWIGARNRCMLSGTLPRHP